MGEIIKCLEEESTECKLQVSREAFEHLEKLIPVLEKLHESPGITFGKECVILEWSGNINLVVYIWNDDTFVRIESIHRRGWVLDGVEKHLVEWLNPREDEWLDRMKDVINCYTDVMFSE